MELNLRIRTGFIYLDTPLGPSLRREVKHFIVDDNGDPTPYYFQLFPVQGNGRDAARTLMLLKQGKKLVKQGMIHVDVDGPVTIDTDPNTPVDAVGEELNAIRAQLPYVQDWKWNLHRDSGWVTTEPVKPGIKLLHNADAALAVCDDWVWDAGKEVRGEYVDVSKATWLVIYRGDTVSEVHVWPGAGENIEEIVEAVNSVS